MPDIKKLEKMLETHFPEPIRSGLDKRSAHIVLIKHRYEYEKWIRAMFDVCKDRFEQNGHGLTIQQQRGLRLEEPRVLLPRMGRLLPGGRIDGPPSPRGGRPPSGYLYLVQLGDYHQPARLHRIRQRHGERHRRLAQHHDLRPELREREPQPGGRRPAWLHLVQQRIITKQVPPWPNSSRWTRRGCFSRTTPRRGPWWACWPSSRRSSPSWSRPCADNKDALAVIKDVYGWDEKKLTAEWHKFVLDQR